MRAKNKNYIFINTKRTRLNLDTFKDNVIDSILFMLYLGIIFALTYIGLLIAYAKGVR
ncbi:hypothetical protein [Helcococcus kunzii]|uniref:hypothetical protein n=1 Tax=Helcococcus kunzii TaxID=40091 RepID=UPI00389FA072